MNASEWGAVGAAPKPVAVLSSRLVLSYANVAFARLFDRPAGDPARLSAAVQSDTSFRPSIERATASLPGVGHSTAFEWWMGPERRPFRVHVTKMADDTFVTVLDELAAQVETEHTLGVVRSYLDGVLNHIPLGVIVLDTDLKVTFYNRTQDHLFASLGLNLTLVDVIGSRIAEIYPVLSASTWDDVALAVTKSHQPVTRAKVGFPADRPTHHVHVKLVPLTDRRRALSGAVCLTEDATRLVQLEEELIKKERLAVVGQMTAKLHHDINNPLVSILGMAETLLFRESLEPDVARRLSKIRNGALRIAEVTKKLRDIQGIGMAQETPGLPAMPDLTLAPRDTADDHAAAED